MKESGDFPPDGMELHVCFGTDGNLSVIELWDSKNEWATYAAEKLGPVLTDIGIEIERGGLEALEVHNLVRR